MAEIMNQNPQNTEKLATIVLDDTVVDMENREVTYKGKPVALTHMERELLHTLITYGNTALSRERLLNVTWGYSFAGETRTVDVHIWKLRRKLHWENRIKTVYKTGYRLEI